MSWNWTSSTGTKTSSSGVPGETTRPPRVLVLMAAVLLAFAACDAGSAPADRSDPTTAPTATSVPAISSAPNSIPETVTTTSVRPSSTTPPSSSPASTLSFDQQRALLSDAYKAMGVEPCCQDDTVVGVVVELGFVYEGEHMFVTAGPAQFLATPDRLGQVPVQDGPIRLSLDGQMVMFECGPSWYSLQYLIDGLASDVPLEAAEHLRAALGCS